MYLREIERARREAVIAARLESSARAAWDLCADASRVLLALHEDRQFRTLAHNHLGLFDTLPALLAPMINSHKADAVLSLLVARTTLRPLLSRVEVLGWLARAHPEELVTLLKVVTPAEQAGEFPACLQNPIITEAEA
jgi:hypothetical protein